jgi:hypothetical protein
VQILDFNTYISPLSSSYEGDDDINFIKYKTVTEEGFDFYKEHYLVNGLDRKINNYSSLYLTNKKLATDIIEINPIYEETEIEMVNSSMIDNRGLYMTLTATEQLMDYPIFCTKDEKFIDPTDKIFEITIFESVCAKITHKSRSRKDYYLSINYDNSLVFNNSNFRFTSIDNPDKTIFECIIDRTNGKICLFKTISAVKYLILTNNQGFSATKNLSLFNFNFFDINYYKQKLIPKINTSWVSYDKNHVNLYEVNPLKSRSNLKNNYLFSSQYSYITGDSISCNFLTLKNQKTNKNYSYRSNYMEATNPNVPSVDNRSYTGLFTGNEQEKGDYGITLSYEFYNADYKFEGDSYTIFTTPESIYPYKQININDLQWNYKGSLAGETPYLSDKIFEKKIKTVNSVGDYLCSWLHRRKNGETVWLDRYYIPERISYADALASTFTYNYSEPINELLKQQLSASEYYDVPHVYNTLAEEALATPQTVKTALYGRSFFDKVSDLSIKPNAEYIYHRIGNDYVDAIVNSISSRLIQNGLKFKNNNDALIYDDVAPDEATYVFDGNSYDLLKNYHGINDEHQFTISMWIQSDDWLSRFGYQILGNLNHKGFALLDDRKITPIITIQNGKNVFTYNTNFEMLDIASLQNENIVSTSVIKDIYRTDHLDSFYSINMDSSNVLLVD